MLSLTTPRRSLLLFFAAALPLASADVEFTSPAPGAVIPVGELHIAWKESGRPPLINQLTEPLLSLYVGGDYQNNSLPLQPLFKNGSFMNSSITALISSGLCGPVPNGFYLAMYSTSRNGGWITNYSPRFTLTGMTGYTPPDLVNAAKDLNGNTAAPPRIGNAQALLSASSSSTPSSTSTSTARTVTVTSAAKSSSSPPAQANTAGSKALSMGAIVGIVIAVLVGASVILGLIIFFLLRRRQRRLRDGVIDNVDPDAFGGSKSPASWKQPSITTLSELSAEGRVMEMGDGVPPPEMDSTTVRAELEGDSIPRPLPPTRDGSMSSSVYESQTPLTPIAPSLFEETLRAPPDFLGSPVTPVSRI